MSNSPPPHSSADLLHVQQAFLDLLPRLRAGLTFRLRHLRRQTGSYEEALTEAVDLTWKWYRRLAERRRQDRAFATALADFASRQVQQGRGVCGQLSLKDVFNPQTQRRQRFHVERGLSTNRGDALPRLGSFLEALHSPAADVLDQVSFRIDFPAWLKTRSRRDRRIIAALAEGHRTQDVARRYRVSEGRISQLRNEYRRDWQKFIGEFASV